VVGLGFCGAWRVRPLVGVHRFLVAQWADCWTHLKRDFQGLSDCSREAEPVGRWGLAEAGAIGLPSGC